MSEPSFSHLDASHQARMVDVSEKAVSIRRAVAEARVALPPVVADLLREGDIHAPKGPVFQTARIAGIQAAKRTAELIPLCHPIGLDLINLEITCHDAVVRIVAQAVVAARTGVEMEAMTAASVAALTIYDMCKAVSPEIEITTVRLIEKTGGKRDFKRQ
ncbi:MAG: cyclic pyranopterin monophosphate synthase MoaC [Flavobacteriales bacterium]|jgi:cyclic pyranopterin phosphate synthase